MSHHNDDKRIEASSIFMGMASRRARKGKFIILREGAAIKVVTRNPHERHDLGGYELRNGNIKRAVKHFIIVANLGCEDTMKELWTQYTAGNISKKNLDATLYTVCLFYVSYLSVVNLWSTSCFL
jgi:hypothetical protein